MGSRGLPHKGHEQRDRQPEQADHRHHEAPSREFAEERQFDAAERDHPADDAAAEQIGETGARSDAGAEDAHRKRQLLRREMTGQQRVGGRRQGGFAHADTDPIREQLQIGARGAGQGGHQAPQGDADGDDPLAAVAVGPACDDEADAAIEDRECGAGEQAERGVRDGEFRLDRLDQQGEDEAVDERDAVGEGEYPDDIPSVGGPVNGVHDASFRTSAVVSRRRRASPRRTRASRNSRRTDLSIPGSRPAFPRRSGRRRVWLRAPNCRHCR